MTEKPAVSSLPPSAADAVVLSVRNVSKMYPLYAKPRHRLTQSLWYALPQFLRHRPDPQFYREFWALHDVSFDVHRGETVGVIGRNGSGKSTLLQIIAGTLAPTHGEVQVHGRVAALLELGSGFNPEFTGRENVYLNGAILGFSQAEIDEIFDDIAAFADIGQFIDQPVKLYSSGMLVRLAFAVQVKVPKEVLIVDEALAVGDEAFQRKCMRALQAFQDEGGSVLLVSHDIRAINHHCRVALLLVDGQLLLKDQSKIVSDVYQRIMYSNATQRRQLLESMAGGDYAERLLQSEALLPYQRAVEKLIKPDRHIAGRASFDPQLAKSIEKSYGNGKAQITNVYLTDSQGQRVNVVISGQRYCWSYQVHFKQEVRYVHFGMMLKTIDGITVYAASTLHEQEEIPVIERGVVVDVSFQIDLNLAPGVYYFNCGVSAIEIDEFVYLHRRVDVAAIRVLPPDGRNYDGLVFMNHKIEYLIHSGGVS